MPTPNNDQASGRRRNTQITGMRGVYSVAAELSARGYIVSVTSREAKAVDLMISDQSGRTQFGIQVKAITQSDFWGVGDKPIPTSPSYFFVFVRFFDDRLPPETEYYIVPSEDAEEIRLSTQLKRKTDVRIAALRKGEYRDNWSVFIP